MLSVQNYNFTTNRNVAFRGKSEDTEGTTKPFQTHAGLKLGIATGALGAVGALSEGRLAEKAVELIKQNQKKALGMDNDLKAIFETFVEYMKNSSKTSKLLAPVIAAVSIGCGVAVDMVANKKHAQIAELKDSSDTKEILKEESRVDTTRNGNAYYKSNTGKKLGTLLGLATYPLVSVASLKFMKYPINAKGVAAVSGITAAMGAIGGFVLGAIADKCGNSAARKAADRQAQEA